MLFQRQARVTCREALSDSIYRIRIAEPEIAASIRPGQFVMVRPKGSTDPLLARPLALYDTFDDDSGSVAGFDLVYLVMGAGTRALSRLLPGEEVDVWGPLGNSFPSPAEVDLRHLLIIAGGIGQTPFVAVIKELLGHRQYGADRKAVEPPQSIRFTWGARTASMLVGLDDFRDAGAEVHVATDDGSAGTHGFVTDLADSLITVGPTPTAIFSCGPEPMLEAVTDLAARHSIPAWVSLETKMACGYGVCFSCVSALNDAASEVGWDYRRVCIEGPVFPAASIKWHV